MLLWWLCVFPIMRAMVEEPSRSATGRSAPATANAAGLVRGSIKPRTRDFAAKHDRPPGRHKQAVKKMLAVE
jgi:hypothetical protein